MLGENALALEAAEASYDIQVKCQTNLEFRFVLK